MRVGNFSVLVQEGRETDTGHVSLTHGGVYTLRLMNHLSNRRCDAAVTVDGKDMGTFRIEAYGSVVLERPAHDDGRFTFYKADIAEFVAVGGGGVADDQRGLIQVVFRPERYRDPHQWLSSRTVRLASLSFNGDEKTCGGITRCMSAGVTGLSGQSGQKFVTVTNLDCDPADEVTISIRLVAGDNGPRPLTAAVRQGNTVPHPVG